MPVPKMWNGVPILKSNGMPAMGDACCCDNGECCCLAKYMAVGEDPDQEFTAVVSGVIEGTGTMTRASDDEGYCGTWTTGELTLSTSCGDISGIVITMRCPTGSTSVDDIEITVTDGGASCQTVAVVDPTHPDAGGTCDPLDITMTDGWTIEDILPDCACDPSGQFFSIHITFP